jgi:lipoprotein-anchoring transpeptidase ErfK/SrfK
MFGSVVRGFLASVCAVLFLAATAGAASANIEAVVDISTQRMYVTVNGGPYAVWKVSTARRGYYTPRGSFRPRLLKLIHYSSKYENSPMPYSVFFYGGYAIHGTEYVRRLGSPASHGCIRLHTSNAADLYYLIKRVGRGNTRIRVVD